MFVFNHLKIGNKLAIIMVGLSIVVIALISTLFYQQFAMALEERVLLQLSSVKNLKVLKIKNELEDRFTDFERHLALGDIDSPLSNLLFTRVFFFEELPDSLKWRWETSARDNRLLIDFTKRGAFNSLTVGYLKTWNDGYILGLSEMPEIQNILLERIGLGQTGESYIVGSDRKLKSQSRFYGGDSLEIIVDTDGVRLALNEHPGEGLFEDYREVEVFSSYEMIDLYGLKWVLLTEIDHQEALFPLHDLRKDLFFILLFIFIFVLVASYLLSKMFVKPVVRMEKKLISMSKGIVEGVAAMPTSEDEIGRMFDALNRLVEALSATIVFADKIGAGKFDADYTPLGPDDKLGEALIRMRERLTDYQRSEEKLLKENQRSIINGEEKERSRLSKEMHDGIGPLLTTLRMQIQFADLDEQIERRLLARLDETITEVRRISNNLMPSVLVDFGAGEAIGNYIDQLRENTGVKFWFKNDLRSKSNIDDSIHRLLYRIAQESINNALKHSQATEIKVSITSFEGHIGYFISDNGIGFDVYHHHIGNGLTNMRERVKLANGSFELTSGFSGTVIEVEIPII
jgi:two-component system, NarL family, sensor kinase